jgi:hypothetical protein
MVHLALCIPFSGSAEDGCFLWLPMTLCLSRGASRERASDP